MTRFSPARKYGSPCLSKISGMVMPAALSISVSASMKGIPSRAASLRPIDDLPAPIMPTSTIERLPSARTTADSRPFSAGFLNGTVNHAMVPKRIHGSIYQ